MAKWLLSTSEAKGRVHVNYYIKHNSSIVIFGARQQIFGKVMFSVVSVSQSFCSRAFSPAPPPHPSPDMGTHCAGTPPPSHLWTWNLTVQGPPPPLRVTSGGHHWRPVQSCSLQDTPIIADILWLLEHVEASWW